MHYKTITLELLQQHPKMHRRLARKRMLLPTLELYASALKTRHEAWKGSLSQARPGSDPRQIASEALEIALAELESCLPPDSPPDENDPLSLDAAMAFLRRHTPPR